VRHITTNTTTKCRIAMSSYSKTDICSNNTSNFSARNSKSMIYFPVMVRIFLPTCLRKSVRIVMFDSSKTTLLEREMFTASATQIRRSLHR
jgi:hypothetical protein